MLSSLKIWVLQDSVQSVPLYNGLPISTVDSRTIKDTSICGLQMRRGSTSCTSFHCAMSEATLGHRRQSASWQKMCRYYGWDGTALSVYKVDRFQCHDNMQNKAFFVPNQRSPSLIILNILLLILLQNIQASESSSENSFKRQISQFSPLNCWLLC